MNSYSITAGGRKADSVRAVRNLRERGVGGVLALCALISILTTAAIVYMLFRESIPFFTAVPLHTFLLGTKWAPLFEPQHFGVLPLVVGTLHITLGSALIAIPLGLSAGIYLSEYASARTRSMIKPILEVLAGVPTIVYGYFALTFVTPMVLKKIFGANVDVFNAASGAIVVAIMILPLIASLCDDAFRAVPGSLRHAAYAMGATKFEVSMQVVLPAALSGVFAAFILALSRAVGETMAVSLAAGNTPNMTWNPLQSIQALTAYIVQIALGEVPHGTIEYQSLFAVAMVLFLITLIMNVTAHKILKRFREVYD